MPSGTRKKRWIPKPAHWLRGLSFCSALLCGEVAFAQDTFTVETYEAAPSSTSVLSVDSTDVPGHLKPSADAVLHRSERAVVFRQPSLLEAVDNRWTLDLGMGLGLFGDLQLDARMPLVTTQSGVGIGNDLSAISAGDLRLRGKWRLLERTLANPVGFAIQGALYVPTGDRDGFTTDGVARFEPRIIVDAELGPVVVLVNAGYQIRAKRFIGAYRHDDIFRWGLGARLPLGGGFDVQGNLFGEHSFMPANVDGGNTPNKFAHPLEALGGFGWNFRGFRVSAAGGAGVTRGVGAPAYRVVFGLGYTPFKEDDELAGRTVIAHDFDDDGFAGDADQCPYSAETFDGFEDLDGCPDDDDDGDMVADIVDLCPMEPGLPAKSGCPAVDRDADGIDDGADACPTIPGSATGDGCPESRESEQWRSRFAVMSAGDCDPEDRDCTPSTNDRIEEFPEAVFFGTGRDRFRPIEHPLLERVAARMRDDPTIVKLVIEGHTDSVGDAEYNKELSRGRAATVKEVMIRRGVDPERLEVEAHGEEQPIDSNETPDGRARNRRVSFRMVVRRRGKEEQIQDVASEVELPTLTIADFEFDRRMLVGFRPPRFVEGATLRAPEDWKCSIGSEEPRQEILLMTAGPPVVQGLRYPGWTTEHRLTCRKFRSVIAFDIEVEIPPFGVRGVWSRGVQLTSRRPTEIELRFAGRAMPLDVGIDGYRLKEKITVSADVLRVRLRPTGGATPSSARLRSADRVLLNVPLLPARDDIDVEPIPPQRRFIEIGGGPTVLAAGRAFTTPGQISGTALGSMRFTARALATNWFSVGGVLDIGAALGPDPLLFAPAVGGEAVFHLPTSLVRPFVSTGVQALLLGLDDARPAWDNTIGLDYEPASGAGLRAAFRATVVTSTGEVLLLPGAFLGTYGTF